jgi:hypothetical protein
VGELAAYTGASQMGACECGGGSALGVVEVCQLRCAGEAEGVVCSAREIRSEDGVSVPELTNHGLAMSWIV